MYRIQWTAVLFVVWLGLTNTLQPQELVAGLLISAAIAWLALPARPADPAARPWRLLGLLAYVPIFLKNLVLSNLDVAVRVLNPRLPINPGIVRVRTDLTAPHQRLLLANSITLTPGTVTLEMDGPNLYIHWLDVRDADPSPAGAAIKDEMEQGIRRV